MSEIGQSITTKNKSSSKIENNFTTSVSSVFSQPLKQLWLINDIDMFLEELENMVEEKKVTQSIINYVETTLKGNDLIVAEEILWGEINNLTISDSVGKKSRNLKSDVKKIQILLNKSLLNFKLVEDGVIGKGTIKAISKYQREVVFISSRYRGRVIADGKTFKILFSQTENQGKKSNWVNPLDIMDIRGWYGYSYYNKKRKKG